MKKTTLIICTLFFVGTNLFSQNGDSSIDYRIYGDQEWTTVNADVVTYRDGTEIPQVTDNTEWSNLTTGAWCYINNDPSKGKLYNWYAVMGIHDTDPNTPNKAFAPEGWHVPTDAEWTTLEEYLIANGYNYDGTTTGNKIGKAMASTTGWNSSTGTGAIGNDQSTNNSSGFNSFPVGRRSSSGQFFTDSSNNQYDTIFWCSTEKSTSEGWNRILDNEYIYLRSYRSDKHCGNSVRFVRDANTASTEDYSKSIKIYPNPANNFITIDSTLEGNYNLVSMLGKTVGKGSLNIGENTLDISTLNKGIYFLNIHSNNNSKTIKIVKE